MNWQDALARAERERARQQAQNRERSRRTARHLNSRRGETWCALCDAWVPRPHTHTVPA